jgi:hypothetical protein
MSANVVAFVLAIVVFCVVFWCGCVVVCVMEEEARRGYFFGDRFSSFLPLKTSCAVFFARCALSPKKILSTIFVTAGAAPGQFEKKGDFIL